MIPYKLGKYVVVYSVTFTAGDTEDLSQVLKLLSGPNLRCVYRAPFL